MKPSFLLGAVVAGAGLLATQPAAAAITYVSGGSIIYLDHTGMSFWSIEDGLTGSGHASAELASATANYSVKPDVFAINGVTLSRAMGHMAEVSGSAIFNVDTPTNYNIYGMMLISELGLPAEASINSFLIRYGNGVDLLADYTKANDGQTQTRIELGTTYGQSTSATGSLSGTLTPGLYMWAFRFLLADTFGTSDDSAAATGRAGIVFSDATVPEPATPGILGAAAAGWLLRRRKY